MKEENYFNLFKAVMDEKGVTIVDLENNKILKHNTFYKFQKFCPTLQNCLSMANFLNASLDYIMENTYTNNFTKPYKIPQNFAESLGKMLKSMKISKRKFCEDMEMSEGTFTKWRKGVQPKVSKIQEICKYLHCNIDDLLETE